jgi:porphobilinogen synthase
MPFPAIRLRRLRANPLVRSKIEETELSPRRLIAPLFVREGRGVQIPIASMPGQAQMSIDVLVREAGALQRRGITSLLLFGIPAKKDASGSQAYATGGIVQRALRALKKAYPETLLIADLCFCEYTSHGHCGIIKKGDVDNDATLKLIAKTAVAQARAGADIIAPSGMMDGMVKTIRQALDKNGFKNTLIMSYAAKYASAFYGPFREAAESAPQFGNRDSYQMNPANAQEALREVSLDIEEGADIIMVKPALAYLDIIRRVKDKFNIPVAAYNVSGEYSMVKAAAQKGWINEKSVTREILTAIRRAGADWIITYHAADVSQFSVLDSQTLLSKKKDRRKSRTEN